MTQFDYLEALKAIRVCVQKPGYKVGVFMRTLKDAKYVCFDMIAAINEDAEEKDAVNRFFSSATEHYIMFKNGSFIQFARASEHCRGRRFNCVLYDNDIDHDILVMIVRPTEFRYKEQ